MRWNNNSSKSEHGLKTLSLLHLLPVLHPKLAAISLRVLWLSGLSIVDKGDPLHLTLLPSSPASLIFSLPFSNRIAFFTWASSNHPLPRIHSDRCTIHQLQLILVKKAFECAGCGGGWRLRWRVLLDLTPKCRHVVFVFVSSVKDFFIKWTFCPFDFSLFLSPPCLVSGYSSS